MCLPRVTSLLKKVLIIREKTVCPSPLSWQLHMSYIKMARVCFSLHTNSECTACSARVGTCESGKVVPEK